MCNRRLRGLPLSGPRQQVALYISLGYTCDVNFGQGLLLDPSRPAFHPLLLKRSEQEQAAVAKACSRYRNVQQDDYECIAKCNGRTGAGASDLLLRNHYTWIIQMVYAKCRLFPAMASISSCLAEHLLIICTCTNQSDKPPNTYDTSIRVL